ncbi:MAG TPA: pyridoxal phosphate-dependent aminotransferase [Piscinibacter sp.]|jgi:aspartate/methionine/tyrosine aminotransferase|uniref:pyridoxal phosphate-dependent aminotransferase n=1 Tax=Piscinibacter sp. TaxID=1903157 RepID=UPI001D78640B|nr:pyridoxal phosphate-dependent aminotransferase [Piscinibacter sp.]MBK7533083.1 pyridoxal phosphate-dependent aminotransferase [Piscinibacter sp.]HOY37289.1 pyridoxal phosphate-dependent aminotransferase [Piscinibacter sp.]HPG79242.1 pyridoxal phosphate-dependent aminotransferase [Piscinibacter sp.]HPM66217.1 pyridoxal phosphate-dependent aminotransferase [Piscinibacter sp.]
MRTAARLDHIEPFYVLECAKAATELARSPACRERPMIFLNIGEPDFTAPPLVREAAERALRDGRTQYTDATGLPALRERISGWYAQRFGLDIAPSRIVVTAGASAALQLACLALVDTGDEVLMPDPSYPCNRHFVAAADGVPVLLPSGPEQRFQLDAAGVEAAWTPRTRGVLLASPSNPTGTSIDPQEMGRIVAAVRARGGFTMVDEIYLGLSYDDRFGHSALAHGDDVISINSFSKYFSMTGWRLGWLVLPESLVPAIEKLAQNLFICASTIAQRAALACFEPDSIAEYERRRSEFKARRDLVVPALNAMGLTVPVLPDGAFYAWADCSAHASSSWDFVFDVMRQAHVALTPGRDFGRHGSERWVRLSYANAMPQLQEALSRLSHWLAPQT